MDLHSEQGHSLTVGHLLIILFHREAEAIDRLYVQIHSCFSFWALAVSRQEPGDDGPGAPMAKARSEAGGRQAKRGSEAGPATQTGH